MRRRRTPTPIDDAPRAAIDQLPWLVDLPRESQAHGWIVLTLFRVPSRAALHAYLGALMAGDVDEAHRLHTAWRHRSVEDLQAAQDATGLVW